MHVPTKVYIRAELLLETILSTFARNMPLFRRPEISKCRHAYYVVRHGESVLAGSQFQILEISRS